MNSVVKTSAVVGAAGGTGVYYLVPEIQTRIHERELYKEISEGLVPRTPFWRGIKANYWVPEYEAVPFSAAEDLDDREVTYTTYTLRDRIYFAYKDLFPNGEFLIEKFNDSIKDEYGSKDSRELIKWCDEKRDREDEREKSKIKYWCTRKKIGSEYVEEAGYWWNDSTSIFDRKSYESIKEKLGKKGLTEEVSLLERLKKDKGREGLAAYWWCNGRHWSFIEDESGNERPWLSVFKDVCVNKMIRR